MQSFGVWSRTSCRPNGREPLSQRGEGIAALTSLATVEVASHSVGERQVSYKIMNADRSSSVVVSSAGYSSDQNIPDLVFPLLGEQKGTLLRVTELFGTLPVRRKSMRADRELAAVKAIVRGLGLLHHAVSWTVLVGPALCPSATSEHREVLSLPAVVSVTKRLLQLHGAECVQSLQEVKYRWEAVTVTGLLSPPTPGCCGATRECQYTYLNGHWLRNCDTVSAPLNALFAARLAGLGVAQGRVGMTPMHVGEGASAGRCFPRFVLSVSCPTELCDITEEPDRTVVLLACERPLTAALEGLVLSIASQLPPSPPPLSVRDNGPADSDRAVMCVPEPRFAVLTVDQRTTPVRAASSPHFSSAFFSGSPSPRERLSGGTGERATGATVPSTRDSWSSASPYADRYSAAASHIPAHESAAAACPDGSAASWPQRLDFADAGVAGEGPEAEVNAEIQGVRKAYKEGGATVDAEYVLHTRGGAQGRGRVVPEAAPTDGRQDRGPLSRRPALWSLRC
jgi:DNA mismatch repair ATPase MutL